MLKKIMIGLFLLVLTAVALIYGKYYITRAIKDRAARKNVNKLHAAADIEGDEIFRSRISKLKQLGVLGEKAAESKADTCYIDDVEAGLLKIETWIQYCQIDYASGYKALLSRDETFERVLALHKDDPTLLPFPTRPGSQGCRFYPGPSNSISYVPADSNPESDECRIPKPVNGVSPRGVNRPGSTKFDYTFDPDKIDKRNNIVWITYTYRYYREDLGCTPDPFCGNSPRSNPIQAD